MKDERKPKPRVPTLAILVCTVLLGASLFADDEKKARGKFEEVQVFGSDSSQVYLRVELETSYGWLWQKTQGRAYTTSDKDGKHRLKVDKLCLTLIAHDTTTQCAEGKDEIIIKEKKRGIGIKKKLAQISAWTEGPALGPEKLEMKP